MNQSRRKFIAKSFPSILLGLYGGDILLKRKFTLNNVFVQGLEMLSDRVGFFTEKGGTIGVYLGQDGITCIDSQFPDAAQNLIDLLQKEGQKPFQYLINTHHHGDHTAGNGTFRPLVEDIVAHGNSKKNQENNAKSRGQEAVLPTVTFEEEISLDTGSASSKIHMYYYGAGHTDGDAVTFIESENVVHTGDLVFNRRFPYIDKSAGAQIGNWVKVLDKINSNFDQDCRFIFGHAEEGYSVSGTHEDIKAFKNYLEKLLEFGQKSLKKGKSLEELKSSTKIIPGAPEWKGEGISRSLDAVYQELEGS